MRIALALLTAAVLLSLVYNAEAQPPSKYDELLELHQNGPLIIPAQVSETTFYVCYSRARPNTSVYLSVEADTKQIYALGSNSEALDKWVSNQRVDLSPTRLPIFNGTLLGGRSVAKNLIERLLGYPGREGLFVALSRHKASDRRLAALLKVRQEQDLEAACSTTEVLEYVCIESLNDI